MSSAELPSWLGEADGASPWSQVRVIVAGLGVAGFAAADALLEFGARVTVLDDADNETVTDRATLLRTLDAEVILGPGSTATLPEPAHLVITTGFSPAAPLMVQAAARGVPVWSEVELAWRLSRPNKIIPWIGITGTNGKTSTARMIDALLRSLDLRTGRFTSPHLSSMTERISLDGEALSEDLFVEAFADVAAYAQIVDDSQEHPLSFFELTVAMAYAAFADAPVDAAVVEVGMGGAWDATNVADAKVAVITPIAVDHSAYLGHDAVDIAREKAGIIKPGAQVVIAEQEPEVLDVLLQRCAEVGATVLREGVDFGVAERLAAVGGQQVALQGVGARYDEVLLTLHGQFQARNAALALAAVEALTGSKELEAQIVRDAFAEVTSPGRLEVVRRAPTIIVDAAHNPHGVAASVSSLQEEFTFSPLVVVLGVMADKDVEEIVRELEPVASHVVCTQNASDRCLPAGELGEIVEDVLGDASMVSVAPQLPDALEQAITRAETAEGYEGAVGSGAVLVTGSVITAGEARVLLARSDP